MVIKSILIWLATNNDKKSTHCRHTQNERDERPSNVAFFFAGTSDQCEAEMYLRYCMNNELQLFTSHSMNDNHNLSHWAQTNQNRKSKNTQTKTNAAKMVMNRKIQTTNAFMGYILSAHSQRTYFCFYDSC